jgi:alpha,alpha-trehalase
MRIRWVNRPVALLCALLPIAAAQPRTDQDAGYPESPQRLYGDLFAAVQTAQIYTDSKSFPDAVPDLDPQEIMAQYHALHPDTAQALKRFIDAHFTLPREATAASLTPEPGSIVEHIDQLWNPLTRHTASVPPYSSLLPLPSPYVVPGGRFREIYYWDSYFTMLGLVQSDRRDLVEDMVSDFAYFIDIYGHVPNGARSYYLSRSQPPFFFEMVALLDGHDPSAAFARYLPQLKAEYAFWMRGADTLHPGTARWHVVALADGSILNRYWDEYDTPRDESYREDTDVAHASRRPSSQMFRDIRAAAESGWDFSSRWFADGRTLATIDTTEILPIDLNSLLYGLENAISSGCRRRADRACATEFAKRAARRRAAIDHYLWDPSSGAYFDYRWTHHERIRRLSAAGLYPLFVDLASEAQAAAVAAIAATQLLEPGGIVATPLDTGQQWDAPNGWAPLQWIAIEGLRHYNHLALAERIACRWMINVEVHFKESGKLVEKYDVISAGRGGHGGEYPLQDGFGWTNGVMRKLISLYPADAAYSAADQCPND